MLSAEDWETRGSGVRAKFRFTATDPSSYCQVQKQWGPKVLGSSKSITFRPLWHFGAETGWQGPHFPRFLRISGGSPGIFFVPENPPQELSALSPTAEHGGFRGPCFGEMRMSGNREIQQRTERRKITDDKGGRLNTKEERGKMTNGGKKK